MSATNFIYRKAPKAPSKSSIELSAHGALRMQERLHIMSQAEMRDHLYKVRYIKGINIDSVNMSNYAEYGIPENVLHYIKMYPHYNTQGHRTYLYNEFIYFFTGKQSRKFITVVKLPDELCCGAQYSRSQIRLSQEDR